MNLDLPGNAGEFMMVAMVYNARLEGTAFKGFR